VPPVSRPIRISAAEPVRVSTRVWLFTSISKTGQRPAATAAAYHSSFVDPDGKEIEIGWNDCAHQPGVGRFREHEYGS